MPFKNLTRTNRRGKKKRKSKKKNNSIIIIIIMNFLHLSFLVLRHVRRTTRKQGNRRASETGLDPIESPTELTIREIKIRKLVKGKEEKNGNIQGL